MKKLLALLLATTMLLSLCACGSPSKPKELEDISDEDWEAAADALEDMYEEEPVVETEATEKIYEIGDIVTTEDGTLEIKIDRCGFTDVLDNGKMMPPSDDTKTSRKAEDGMVFFYYVATVTLIEDVKEETLFFSTFELHYNQDYQFISSSNNAFQNGVKNYEVQPLMGTKTVELRGYMEVPKAVETDTEGSLVMPFTFATGHYGSSDRDRTEFIVKLR